MGCETLGESRDGWGPSKRSGTGRRTIVEDRHWSGTPREVLDGSGDPREGPGQVGGH